MRDTLAGDVSESRGSREAVTTTDSETSVGSAAVAASGSSAATMNGMRMIGWPIIATNDYPYHGDDPKEFGKSGLVCRDFSGNGVGDACAGSHASARHRPAQDRAGAFRW